MELVLDCGGVDKPPSSHTITPPNSSTAIPKFFADLLWLTHHSDFIYGGAGTCGHCVMPWENRRKNIFPASNVNVRQADDHNTEQEVYWYEEDALSQAPNPDRDGV